MHQHQQVDKLKILHLTDGPNMSAHTLPKPWVFSPQLKQAYLEVIAQELLDVFYDTQVQLSTVDDDNYTRGTCTFGRQKNRIIRLCMSGQHPWLKLTNPNMDVTFEIDGIPVRLFADDPENPKKPHFFRHNAVDWLFETEVGAPVLHRFVLEKPELADEEARIHFVGYDAQDEPVSLWTYRESVMVPHKAGMGEPQMVDITLDDIDVAQQHRSAPEQDADSK